MDEETLKRIERYVADAHDLNAECCPGATILDLVTEVWWLEEKLEAVRVGAKAAIAKHWQDNPPVAGDWKQLADELYQAACPLWEILKKIENGQVQPHSEGCLCDYCFGGIFPMNRKLQNVLAKCRDMKQGGTDEATEGIVTV